MTTSEDEPVHQPRTLSPGDDRADTPVVRPRTVGALGIPRPIEAALATPPLESFEDPSWQPPSSQVEAIVVEEASEAATQDGETTDQGLEAWTGGSDRSEGAAAPARLLRANLLVASGTAASRLTGLVRTSLILVVLGKGLNDAYVNANNTPNMIYELILGGILTAALVPLFTDDLEKGDGRDATSAIISAALVALVVVTLAAIVLSPGIILLLSTGSAEATRDDYLSAGIPLALLFAPQVFFYGLMAVWSAVLNSRHRFMAAAWAPVLNNLVAIATLVVASRMVDENPTLDDALSDPSILWVLGLGTSAGIVLMALSLYPAVRRAGVRLNFALRLKHPAVQRAIRLSGWTLGYVIANQIAVIVIQILAKPSSGDPTRYQTAFQWFQLPHALLAVSIMVTFEPLLGRADSRGDRPAYNTQMLLGYRLIGLLIIPAAVGYVALPKALDYRTFTATGELATALGLTGIIAAFAVGLPGFSTYLYTLRGFYAMKNTKTPFIINCIENALNIAFAVVFVRIWGVVGLALSFALAYSISAVLAVVVLTRASPGFDWRGLVSTWTKLLLAAAIMGGFVYGAVAAMEPGSALALLPAIGVGLLVGGVTYFAAIFALRVAGISELMARLPGLRRFA